jgi:hypothetical protein
MATTDVKAPSKTQQIKETITKYRYNRTVRTVILVALLLILLAMYFLRGKMKWLLLVLIVVITLALWVQVADYDLDLGTLWKTGSFTESRVQTKKWVKIVWSDCLSDSVNCSNFQTQSDAQNKYEYCSDKIALQNDGKDKQAIKNLDVFGLDGDKDGTVCEALPKWAAVN